MKTAALLVAASVLFTSSVLAQSAPSASVPPPPGINDPGVKATESQARPAVRQRSTHVAPSASGQSLDLKPQALPAMRDEGSVQSSREQAPPEVRIRQEGDNSIQEYSRNGRVYMVVVTPKNGIQQTYMVDPQGRLVDEHGMKPVGPVMYKVLEWGKSRPPAENASEAPPADNGH
ncbi:hypothetical protein RHOFW104T7_11190 [Rhodanobacter thiooxydans]|uniref:DUF2782 domain-containing protein n=1 Tax=Rhodanobacter thiooxydans TaxID=416169 RepID=A0A154QIH5_9GAMM|nr:DUF2782 domain-containing protein [Rhodanobacter thiooxydans]EIL96578.1 hypothetical protein UUA_17572 [Rhodanobacter thiooxydans LCS2]KZC23957.1 hypothetical protein RHOFW104T7_11190 [Rhodanobacter thiooxydans]MCW0201762.1 DUF2782 domain-containing protein [Rhodanobacter thiooxydans]